MAEAAGGERESGRGVGLLDAGMDEGAGSGRCRVEASAKLKSELSNASRISAKIVEAVELLVRASGNASEGTEAS